jgi:hypothetical protein
VTDLERRLTELSVVVDVPPTPDLATRVTAALADAPGSRRPWQAWVGAGAVAGLLLVSLVVAPVRSAIADWLGIGGVSVDLSSEPLPDPGPVDIDLGATVTLDEAGEAVDFAVLIPSVLGEPEEVRLAAAPTGALVYLVYGESHVLPPAPGTGVGALITQFRASIAGGTITKVVPSDGSIEEVEVRSAPGLWISGGMHLIGLLLPDGSTVEDSTRLAANTLLWEEGGITYRIESGLGLEGALEIAESMG